MLILDMLSRSSEIIEEYWKIAFHYHNNVKRRQYYDSKQT